MATSKRTYSFGGGKAEGSREMKDLLGGKGAGLAEMSNIGIPVPPGFTITTDVCTAFYANGKRLPKDVVPAVEAALRSNGHVVTTPAVQDLGELSAQLPQPAATLFVPRRWQGEVLGQRNALRADYAGLGLRVEVWDEAAFALG